MEDVSARSAPPDQQAHELVGLANELVGRIWLHHQSRFAEFDLSASEAKALLSLRPGTALSMRELSGQLHANPSNVTVVVARLEARGLLARGGVDDRRVKSVRLTESGERTRHQLESRLMEGHPVLYGLSPNQRNLLHGLLRRLSASGRQPPR